MREEDKPIKRTYTHQIGNLTLTFTSEKWDEQGFLDTYVNIGEHSLCAITHSDIEPFVAELNAVISKYSI